MLLGYNMPDIHVRDVDFLFRKQYSFMLKTNDL